MPGRLGEPPSPPFYSPVSTHGAQAPQGGPAHSAAGTIGTLVLGAVQLREPLWGGRVDADLEQVAAGAAVGRMVRGGRRRTGTGSRAVVRTARLQTCRGPSELC